KASRSRVIVPNCCSSGLPSAFCPVGSGTIRQAVMLFLWTSKPAHRGNTTSMAHLHIRWGLAGYPEQERLPCVLDFRRKLATVRGAGRYPGPVLSQARGTNPNTTSRPAFWRALSLQRHFGALAKFARVESRFCGRKRRGKGACTTPLNPCVRSVCSTTVAVGLRSCFKTLTEVRTGT